MLFFDTLVKKISMFSILYMLYLIFNSAEDEAKTNEVIRIEEEIERFSSALDESTTDTVSCIVE